MDGLWKTLLKWMIWGYHYFRKHPIRMPAKPTNTPDISLRKPTQHIIGGKPLPDTIFASKLCFYQTAEGNGASASNQDLIDANYYSPGNSHVP